MFIHMYNHVHLRIRLTKLRFSLSLSLSPHSHTHTHTIHTHTNMKKKVSRLQYLSSPVRVREKVGRPLRTSASVEEAILLHDSTPNRIYNRPTRKSSAAKEIQPLDLPWLRDDRQQRSRQDQRSTTKLPYISSKVSREEYEKLRRECERLKRLLLQKSNQHNNNDNNDNDTDRREDAKEEQQLVQFDLGMQFKSVERMLNSLDNVFVDTAREVRIRWNAALLLQTTVRKFVARTRFLRFRDALHRFRSRHCTSLVNRIDRLRKRNRNNLERVRNMCAKRMMHTSRLVFRHWRREAARSRPAVKAKLRDAMRLLTRRNERRILEIFQAWSHVASGPNSRKAVKKRYKERFERTRERIREDRQEKDLPGIVTRSDIVKEMEREAIQIVRSKRSRFSKMVFFAAWERTFF